MSATAPSPNSPPKVNSAAPPADAFPTADSNPTAVSPASSSNNATNTPPIAATPPPQSTPTVPNPPPPSDTQPPPSPPDTLPPPSPPPPSSPPPSPLLPLPLTPPAAPPPADNPPPPPLVVLPPPSPKGSPPPPPPPSVVAPPPQPKSSPPNPSPPPPAPVEPLPSSPPPKASPSPPPPVSGVPPRSPPADSPPSKTSPPPPHANPPKDSPPTPALPPPPGALPAAPPPPGALPAAPPPPGALPAAPPPSILSPPDSTAPPPPTLAPPDSTAPPPSTLAPPDSIASPPPSVIAPPNSTAAPPPPSSPTSSLPPSLSPPAPQNNSSSAVATPGLPLPSRPAEKPTARATIPSPNITTATTTRDAGGVQSGGAVAIGLVGFFALSLVVFSVWFVQKRKKKRSANNLGYVLPSPFASSQHSDSTFLRAQHSAVGSANHSPYHSAQLSGNLSTNSYMNSDPGGLANSRSWFTYEELGQATNGFSKNNLLGEGGFGCVYKGVLADGKEVAVKQLKSGGGQGEREFRAEVEIISRIHHRHLVTLVGYCISDHQRLLVYDFVANDTLYYHLHDKEKAAMTWETRFKVAAGAARGIAYLHEDCTPRIFHRDIKSANILLDNNFEARVADFGLAKLVDIEAHTHVSTRVMGTFGYMAPEYATTGKLTEKSDVFSFGVVLLELITGRKPVDGSQPLGDESLVEWARPLLNQALENENFEDVIDPRLEENYVESEVFRMIEAAAACIRHSASKRPRMSQVARAFESSNEPSDLTNGMKPGQSQIFDSRQHSTQIKLFQRMAFGSQEYSTDFFNDSQSSWRTGL